MTVTTAPVAARASGERPPRAPVASRYYRAIDGLRGVTILSVLVYHTGLYENGLFGVDMFFVLSGFLITLMLLRDFGRHGRIDLRRFYVRRFKRLAVPLLVMLAGTAAMVLAWGRTDEIERAAQQGLASLVYLTNWEQIYRGDAYWDSHGVPGPLAHMWSLAITEQFYVLWPPLLALAVVVAGRRAVPWVIVAGVVLFAASTAVPLLTYDGTNADRLYLATDSRGASLLAGAIAGAILAVAHGHTGRSSGRRRARSQRQLPSALVGIGTVAAAGAIVWLSVRTPNYRAEWLYSGGLSVIAALGAALTLTLVRDDTLPGRILGVKPLVEIGKISYSLFLVHVPIFWAVQNNVTEPGPVPLLLYGIPLSVVVAAFVHHVIGEPARIRAWSRKGRIVALALITAVTASLVALPSMAQSTAGSGDVRLLTLGDSLGHDFASALSTYYGEAFTVTDGALGGCGVASPEITRTPRSGELDVPHGCLPWEDRWRGRIQEVRPDLVLVNLAWDGVEQRIDGQWLDACHPAYGEHYRAQLESMADILVGPGGATAALVANSRVDTPVNSAEAARCHTTMIEELTAEQPRIGLLDLTGFVCSETECETHTPGGALMYSDRVHFTESGKQHIAPWLATAIADALGIDPPGAAAAAPPRQLVAPHPATLAAIADLVGASDAAGCDDTPIEELDAADAAFVVDRTGYLVCGGAEWRAQIHTYGDDALAHHAAVGFTDRLKSDGWLGIETGDPARRVRYHEESGRLAGMLRTNFNVTAVETVIEPGLDLDDIDPAVVTVMLDEVWMAFDRP